MNSITVYSTILRLIKNNFVRGFCICQLLSINYSSWAQDQMDLTTTKPILVYQISHEILAEQEALKIEVYSDGYALLHYPSYMKNAGDYSVQLSSGNMRRMIHTLNSPNIRNFNNKEIGLQKKAQNDNRNIVRFMSDNSYSSFEMRRSDENGDNKIKQLINCAQLQFDAKNYPSIHSLKKLAEIETLLSTLIGQPDLQELKDD